MLLLFAAALAASTPHGRHDDDDNRPKRHAVRHVPRDRDDDEPAKPAATPQPAAVPHASPPISPIPDPSRTQVIAPTAGHDDRADADHDDDQERTAPESDITVTARRLDAARAAIEPSLGASTYTLSNDAVENRPGGETRTLGSIMLQAPGVSRDGRGMLVVRGATGGLQYRLNNIILPGGAGDFGEALSARLAGKTELITGALPAQYGLAPGGVVNVTTKNGHYLAGGQAELYGGAHGSIEPAVEWSHAVGSTSLFVSTSAQRTRVGLPAPDASNNSLHDRRRELEGFAFLDHLIGNAARISLIAGSVNERQQIPALAVAGLAGSEQRLGSLSSHSHYAIAAYQLGDGPLSLQTSLSGLLSRRALRANDALRLAVDGRSFRQRDRRRSATAQVEGGYTLNAHHLIRAGIVASTDHLHRDERSITPTRLLDRSLVTSRSTTSLFAQDQWSLTNRLTANLGLRADRVGKTDGRFHFQPRASLVWASAQGLTAHLSYARSIVAVPLDDLPSEIDPLRTVERDDVVDAGIDQRLGGLTLGLSLYDRHAHDFVATRWRTDAPLGDAFSYATAHMRGAELVATFAHGPFTGWSNIAVARATARGLSGGRTELTPTQAAYVSTHRAALDNDQRMTLSGGFSYRTGPLLFSASVLAGSGTPRSDPSGAPNGERLPGYIVGDLAAVWHLALLNGLPTDLRVDVRNVTNRHYQLSDGSGLAAGVPGYIEARGLYIGVEQSF